MIEHNRILSIIQLWRVLILLSKAFIRVYARIGSREYLTCIWFLIQLTLIIWNLLLLFLVFEVVIEFYWSLFAISAHWTIEAGIYSRSSLIVDDATAIRDYFAYVLAFLHCYGLFAWYFVLAIVLLEIESIRLRYAGLVIDMRNNAVLNLTIISTDVQIQYTIFYQFFLFLIVRTIRFLWN